MDDKIKDANKTSNAKGIFSTPDLAVDAEKLQRIKDDEAAQGKQKARVAAFFANTDATKDAQQLNNAMSQPASEDVVLQNAPKKKSKAPLIIVAALAVVVAVVAVVIVLNQNNSNNDEAQVTNPTSAQEAFRRYVNFLSTGVAEDTVLQESSFDANQSKLSSIIFSNNKNESMSFLNNAEELFTSFNSEAARLTSTDEVINASLMDVLSAMKSQLDAAKEYASITAPNYLEIYIQKGAQQVLESTSTLYEDLIKSNNATLKQIAESQQTIAKASVLVYEAYNRSGCISNEQLDENCAESMPRSEEVLAAESDIFLAQDELWRSESSLSSDIFDSCYSMNDLLNSIDDAQEGQQ